jgi:hypothetical protein
VDPHWSDIIINPTRSAIMCSDTWATVSCSYRADLLSSSPQKALLAAAPEPFAHPNGIPVAARKLRLMKLPTRTPALHSAWLLVLLRSYGTCAGTHAEAKAFLQKKYFYFEQPDLSMPLFAFVGRITQQKVPPCFHTVFPHPSAASLLMLRSHWTAGRASDPEHRG